MNTVIVMSGAILIRSFSLYLSFLLFSFKFYWPAKFLKLRLNSRNLSWRNDEIYLNCTLKTSQIFCLINFPVKYWKKNLLSVTVCQGPAKIRMMTRLGPFFSNFNIFFNITCLFIYLHRCYTTASILITLTH